MLKSGGEDGEAYWLSLGRNGLARELSGGRSNDVWEEGGFMEDALHGWVCWCASLESRGDCRTNPLQVELDVELDVDPNGDEIEARLQ